MGALDRRLDALEALAGATGGDRWDPPTVTVDPGKEPDRGRLAAMRSEALGAGWDPEAGRPYVVIVELSEATDGRP